MLLTDSQLKQLDVMRLAARERARGGAGGARRSRLLGSSAEFSDFREYAPGDDVRRIDWNAYARFDRLFLKLFMEERETAVHIMLDVSASMADKWQTAAVMAEMIGYLALCGGDRARVYALAGNGVSHSGFLSGRKDFLKLCDFIEGVRLGGTTRIDEAVAGIPVLAKGLCVLISDLFSGDDFTRGIKLMRYRGQEPLILHALSPLEMRPELEGAVRLIDSESGETVSVSCDADALCAYQAALDEFLRRARADCRACGAEYILCVCDEEAPARLLKSLGASRSVR